MTPFRWVLLCILFTLYLLLGGSIFMVIEQHHEIHQKEELHVLRHDIQEILFRLDHNFYSNETSPDVLEALTSAKEGVIKRIGEACSIDNLLGEPDGNEPSSMKWNYYNSVFFAFTVVTTIGYGHLSPSTTLSKSLMMVYALFGIPLNGILLSGVGDYFSNKLVKVHQKSKDKQYKGKALTLVFEIIFYLIPGIVVFIIIPAGIFVLIEGWSFLDSVYFSFVSLTTIGFGDYVAGMGDGHNIWSWLYKAFIIIWITFGLGYLIMILGFIAKGMKSKKVRGVLEKRITGIRNTKEKLSKDIDYMRKIVNELYMMKIKPVYDVQGQCHEESINVNGTIIGIQSRRPSCMHFERKSSSLPRLPIYGEDGDLILPQAGRHCYTKHVKNRNRRLSESDLSRVNRDETFANLKESVASDDLLATVVDALSGNMQKVIEAVDELNKYEEQVEHDKRFGLSESPEDSGDDQQRRGSDSGASTNSICDDSLTPTANYKNSPWELRVVSESDETVLLDEDEQKPEQLECVVVHKTGAGEGVPSSFMDKVSGALRKISGTMTPPSSPRKISRNESDSKRKISRAESEKGAFGGTLRNPHAHSQYSPFLRRPSTRRQPLFQDTADGKSQKLKQRQHGESRKISQESTSSFHNLDELMNSVRASRKNTPAAQHPHPHSNHLHPPGSDQMDSSVGSEHGRSSLEASTSSLANFIRALDNVQDKLHKTSVCSDASFSDMSSRSDAYDRNYNGVTFNPGGRQVPGRFKLQVTMAPPSSPESFDRRRKNGIFQPGFSYVNFGYNPEEDDDEEAVKSLMKKKQKKSTDKQQVNPSKDADQSNNNNESIESMHMPKER